MASKREVVVATENYLRSKGYNNSTGKYDRVIMGVKSLLGETLLAYGSPEFERAIQQETERMLKKYVKDSAMEYDPIMCMMVPKNAKDAERLSDKNVNELRKIAVSLGADESKLYGTSKQALIIIIDKLKKNSKANDVSMAYDEVMAMMKPATTKGKRTADDAAIIGTAKAYVKDAERLYNAAKKAKEDFFSTRDEYANRIRTYWVRNKQNMSSEEEEACKSAISKLNGMSYF